MLNNTDLQTALQEHLHWNRARITFIVAFVLALMKVTTVNLTKLANALGGTARKQSNYRRIQRFLAPFPLDYRAWAQMLLRLFPIDGDFVISIDRTHWRFGRFEINILMAALVYQGTAYPLVWILLPKTVNSNTGERVADREFIGKQWFKPLDDYGLRYYIRIRQNARISYRGRTRAARVLFRDLKPGQSRRLRKPRLVYGQWVFVATLRLERDYLIVVSNTSAKQALEIYRLRWGIEVLFAALESRGFNFEETHLVDRERIAKLVALLALAFPWAHLVGLWLAEAKPPKMQESWAPGAASVPVGVGSVAVCVAEPDASACGFFRVCVVAHRTANRARHT